MPRSREAAKPSGGSSCSKTCAGNSSFPRSSITSALSGAPPHAAHLEAKVSRADGHLDRRGLEIALDRVRHRLREALLQARNAGDLANEARDRADATNPIAGHVAHRRRSEIGNEMMRAHAVDGDPLEADRFPGVAPVSRRPEGAGLPA